MSVNMEAKNTVSADGQVCEYITTCGKEGGSPRIMIVGNSITRHEPNCSIGWNFNHGMAASAPEFDYVHLVQNAILEKHPDAEFCVVQVGRWEMKYRTCDIDCMFSTAKSFSPDLIITVLGANIPSAEFTREDFLREMGKLHAYLSGGRKVRIIQSSTFFRNDIKNEAIKAYCDISGAEYLYISDIAEDKDNLAIGKFWHEGVANHPGNNGMKLIAERIIEKIKL